MGNKAWSIVFGVVMLACAVGSAVSPFVGWWMPEGVSTHADEVDRLFVWILYVTAFFFVLTEGILVYFMWAYASTGDGKRPVREAAEHPSWMKPVTNILHDQHRVEMAWTLVPAVILLAIAFVQIESWARIKYQSRNDAKEVHINLQVAVSARQFEWRLRYPSVERFKTWKAPAAGKKFSDMTDPEKSFATFGKIPHADDVYTVNELHLAKLERVQVHLTTRDVIHSFNLPNFRVKQDALPGKMIPVWFTPTKANCKWDEKTKRYQDGYSGVGFDNDHKWDIACAELCGWGHYRMIGRVFVHEDPNEFLDWLTKAEAESRKRSRD